MFFGNYLSFFRSLIIVVVTYLGCLEMIKANRHIEVHLWYNNECI